MTTKLLLVFVIILLFLFSPIYSYAEGEDSNSAKVDSFELFWPLSAGMVLGEKFYFLKQLKEDIRGAFIFGDFNKAKYYIVLSEKRLLETEKLLTIKNDNQDAEKTLQASEESLKIATNIYKNKLSEPFSPELKVSIAATVNKQMKLSNYLVDILSNRQKQIMDLHRTFLNSIVDQLKQ